MPSGIGPKPNHQTFRTAPPIHDQRASIPLQKTKPRRLRSSDSSNHGLGQGSHAHCALQREKSLWPIFDKGGVVGLERHASDSAAIQFGRAHTRANLFYDQDVSNSAMAL
jgi:hypothetical protein